MFTGIIEGFGAIAAIRSAGQGRRLTIEADFDLDQTRIGDSLCVSGACLTAVKIDGRHFEVDISPETLQMTTFGQAKNGQRVNIERALLLSDRIDGIFVVKPTLFLVDPRIGKIGSEVFSHRHRSCPRLNHAGQDGG